MVWRISGKHLALAGLKVVVTGAGLTTGADITAFYLAAGDTFPITTHNVLELIILCSNIIDDCPQTV